MHNEQLTPIPDIAFRIDDDGEFIDLEQDDGIGEVNQITLHRIHLAHIAREAGLLGADAAEHETAARLRERLDLMAALVVAHTRPGDALRAVVAVLLPGQECAAAKPPASPIEAPCKPLAQDQPDMPAPAALPPSGIPATDTTMTLPGM